jgi:hypothetical protein
MRALSWRWKSSVTYSEHSSSLLASLFPDHPIRWAARVLIIYVAVGVGGTGAAYALLSLRPQFFPAPETRPKVSEPAALTPGRQPSLKGVEFDTNELLTSGAPVIGRPVYGENGAHIGSIYGIIHMLGDSKSYVVISVSTHGTSSEILRLDWIRNDSENILPNRTVTVPDDALRLVGSSPSDPRVTLASLSTKALLDLPDRAVCGDQSAGLSLLCRPGLSLVQSRTSPVDGDMNSKTPITINGNNNAVSVGQSGGVTTGIYINQAKAELKLLGQKDQDNPDGSHTAVFAVGIEAPFSPGKLNIHIQADGLINVSILPPAVGGIVTMQKFNVRQAANSYSADIPAPASQYEVSVQTKTKGPISVSYQF